MARWTKEECRTRYVQGAKISFARLSGLSAVPLGTLKTWTKQERWSKQRNDFQAQVRGKADAKAIDGQSNDLAVLEIEHVSAYSTLRRVAMAKVEAINVRINQAAAEIKLIKGIDTASLGPRAVQEEQDAKAAARGEAVRDHEVVDLQALTNIVDRCIKGERMILGAEYEDLNKAVLALTRQGLRVINHRGQNITGCDSEE
ncbi:hypothetical protein IQ266_25650 [filamentous cyanobacterium LEGE 11480]|uniref:Terminase n=1 Tax=Romeriopsis navalis LEGE 11480 TaxID=2777977 RepID=A0A928VV84_9CYAN|nr:hypothetical protein [Romeriopsis navalis]MBE9033127.1 hypothetical protein [Romeriopsis navalis LEGE 11480]